ncbi:MULTISPECIES: type IA DNA topoisomerase [unclassified Streptococcus]|uniref:type IA DNA topoisomerase n=1 Tax=unclassified Streptococcus TaxID=2608887 RepID=UPI00211ABDA5|nr:MULTISPECIES: DNA topoisomerase [unclassified Streptococcus]MCQ9212395.1 DNA topoisomerase [Streptococcus sp. B01]MCQ9213735.1 DNA topoisomerase [Streptococcus sp. O1]MCQ9214503.1 DNA topoisomerase [Streptococcus sp. O1]
MKRVILAEKPEQALAYAQALGCYERRGEMYFLSSSSILKGELMIVYASGHLFNYPPAEDNWRLENLPLVEVDFSYQLKKGKEVKKLFQTISSAVTQADEIIIATDSDREGERIAYVTLSQIPGALEKIRYRLWNNSLTKKGVERAFQDLRNPKDSYAYYLEAEARAQSDWLVGMNLSPLVTLELQEKGLLPRKKGAAMSVGRVQTAIVHLVCKNDQAIQSFIPQEYAKLYLEERDTKQEFIHKEPFFNSKEVLEKFRGMKDEAVVTEVLEETCTKQAPLLFDLSDLQAYAASKWKMTATEVLAIAEKLYLKKFLSYPRTESHVIGRYEFEELRANIASYQEVLNFYFPLAHPEARKEYVDDKQAQKHQAIIPTGNIPTPHQLTKEEWLIYVAVVKRSLLIFAKDCSYVKTRVTVVNNGLSFIKRGRKIIDFGYLAYMDAIPKNFDLAPYTVGQRLSVKARIKTDHTKPPKRFTEARLIKEILPKYGLGTAATRAGMIKLIQERNYVQKHKETGQFYPTNKGYLLIRQLKDNEFADPHATGGWEYFLSQIGQGQTEMTEFVSAIKDKIAAQVRAVQKRSQGGKDES